MRSVEQNEYFCDPWAVVILKNLLKLSWFCGSMFITSGRPSINFFLLFELFSSLF